MKIYSISGEILFEDNSTTIKETVENAVKQGADLRWADLSEADLSEADLSEAKLSEANLYRANLSEAKLSEANLYRANLYRANLSEADLSEANLYRANLYRADLRWADLSEADLSEANLSEADLSEADLSEADLRWADLYRANLYRANLSEAKLPDFNITPLEGSFKAWKKGFDSDDYPTLITIEIPSNAKRTSSLNGRKCRASEAKVLSIIRIKDNKELAECGGWKCSYFRYKVGETVLPDSYNDDIRVQCTNGIHFFMTEEEARNY